MPRITRIAVSFFAVLAAYWAYGLVVVPLVEPTASRRAEVESRAEQRRIAGTIDRRVAALAELFPPNSWALKNPKILESDQFQLLMQDYRNRGDGRLELRPCAIILTPDGPAEDEEQRRRRAIVLEAPEGAVLEFDRPLDLRRAEMGQIVGGQLQGRITIRSQGESPGPEDDLLIVTRDVEMTPNNIFTPHAVDFRLGPHHGRGRELRIRLLEGKPVTGQPTPNVAGIELIELRKVERLYLQLGEVAADQGGGSTNAPPGGFLAGQADLPVEITCEGPFRFDVPGKVASFEDRVRVLRLNPESRDDQLDCDRLAVYFIDRDPPKETASRDGTTLVPTSQRASDASLDLVPQRIEATGDPVTVSAPGRGVEARGQLLRYNLINGQIMLGDDREAMLRQHENEIRARRLVYQPGKPGRSARMSATGPGWLRGYMADRPDEPLEVSWKKVVQVAPKDGQQVIRVDGNAWLRFRGVGQLEAETIHFRLDELPAEEGQEQPRLQPNSLTASNDVRIRSLQLDASVDKLTVLFSELPPSAGTDWQPGSGASGPLRRIRSDCGRAVELATVALWEPAVPGQAIHGGSSRFAPPGRQIAQSPGGSLGKTGLSSSPEVPMYHGAIRSGAPPHSGNGTVAHQPQTANAAGIGTVPHGTGPSHEPATAMSAQRFEVTGKTLHARVLLGGQTAQLAEVSVEGDARFAETQATRPDERPVLVRGERIHVIDAETPRAAVTVTGTPAQFEGRGMAMEGPQIHLNRGTNRLLVDGAGTMTLPLDRDLDGRPLAVAARMAVDWRHRMDFDGRTARFEDSVVARTPQQSLKTELLEVQFQQAIRFADADLGAPPQVEQVLCRGRTLLESHSVDEGLPTARERMLAADLAVNLLSGDLTARGPGWLMSVRQAPDGGSLAGSGGPFPAPPLAAATEPDLPLRQLYVRFQGGMTGNVHRRELNFHDEVRTIYTPVASWEAPVPSDDPQSLGPRGIVMNCNRLSLRQTLRPDGSQHTAEFEAAGNTVVESAGYTARAIRMTYSEAKDLLVLEGDGRSDAQLFRQQQIGGPMAKAAAQRILFWPGSNRLKVDGARSLELSQFQAEPPGSR
ncbi:MAG: hypothetical protein RBS80_06655 [Thermoguttaceae bacterium]|jgi:lipopolysaccharide export system protein LptA|nr:hypothetical protein [Thermoguttaceae bacterium]